MKVLLDTQIAIWAVSADRRLSGSARAFLADDENEAFVSSASIWEIAIKYSLLKRRDVPPFSGAKAIQEFRAAGFGTLDVTPDHAAAIELLPRMHADPFDRLLLAQAITETLRFITADSAMNGLHPCVVVA
jgi:PIN domain nuclease of toxin-antitoxin system